MNNYIFESFEAAPPVTFATRNCDNSCAQKNIIMITDLYKFTTFALHLTAIFQSRPGLASIHWS